VAEGMGPKTRGQITKEYFPIVADRLKMKINITHNFTTMVTGAREHKIILAPI